MKKSLLLLFLMLQVFIISAQDTQFANIYDLQYGNEHGGRLLIVPDGYIIASIGICQDIESGVGCSPLMKIDKSGNLLNYKIFVKNMKMSPYRAIHNVNDTVYVCGSNRNSVPYRWKVFKCNFDLDSIGGFEKTYFGDTNLSLNGMMIKGDYIYMVGKELIEFHSKDKVFWVLKTDKQGNLVKKRQLDDIEWYELDNFDMDITMTADGYFAISYSSYQNVSYPDTHGRREKLIKFDDNLDTIWAKEFGLNTKSTHVGTVSGVEGTRDGGFAYNTVISLEELYEKGVITYDLFKIFGETQLVLHKLNGDGDIQWSDTLWVKRYETNSSSPHYILLDVKEMRNGDIVIVGKYKDFEKDIYSAMIRRYTKDGELRWEKIYDEETIEDEATSFYKMREEDNGDLVCAGFISYDNKVPHESFTWVVRLDSMGCFDSGCGVSDSLQVIKVRSGFITKTNEVISDYVYSDGLLLYPNPSSKYLNIKILEDFRPVSLSIFDMQGAELLKTKAETLDNLDISTLKSGIYIVKLTNKRGENKIGKFVKGE